MAIKNLLWLISIEMRNAIHIHLYAHDCYIHYILQLDWRSFIVSRTP